jgi:hypothetical protein
MKVQASLIIMLSEKLCSWYLYSGIFYCVVIDLDLLALVYWTSYQQYWYYY